jgi:hypothetical protein
MRVPSIDELAAVLFRAYQVDLNIILEDPELSEYVSITDAYVRDHFTSSPAELPFLFVNGIKYEGANLAEGFVQKTYPEYDFLTKLYLEGKISDQTPDIFEYLMEMPSTIPGYNPLIITSKAKPAALIPLFTSSTGGKAASTQSDTFKRVHYLQAEKGRFFFSHCPLFFSFLSFFSISKVRTGSHFLSFRSRRYQANYTHPRYKPSVSIWCSLRSCCS